MDREDGRNPGHIEDQARRPGQGCGGDAAGDESLACLVRVAAADVTAAAGNVMTAAPGPAPDAVLARRLAEAARVARATRATQTARAAPAAPGAFPDSALALLAVEVLALAAVVLAATAAPDGTTGPVTALVQLALFVNVAAMPVAGGIIVWLRRMKAHEGANA